MSKKIFLPLFFFAVKPLFGISILILQIDSNITFDLSLSAGFPPTSFPTYYFPTSASSRNPEGIRIRATIWNFFGASIANAYLDVRGGGDLSTSIALNQLYWSITPAPLPPSGTLPPPPWTSLSTFWQNIDVVRAPQGLWGVRTYTYDMDFCFQLQEDDEPTPPEGASTVIYIRFYGL